MPGSSGSGEPLVAAAGTAEPCGFVPAAGGLWCGHEEGGSGAHCPGTAGTAGRLDPHRAPPQRPRVVGPAG